jgi:hypothetical protein
LCRGLGGEVFWLDSQVTGGRLMRRHGGLIDRYSPWEKRERKEMEEVTKGIVGEK